MKTHEINTALWKKLDEIQDHLDSSVALTHSALFFVLKNHKPVEKHFKVALYPMKDNNDRYRINLINPKGSIAMNIYFKQSTDERTARRACISLTKILFGYNSREVFEINSQFAQHRAKKEERNKMLALTKVVSSLSPEALLQIPEIKEAVERDFSHYANDVIKKYEADPGTNNLNINYTTMEIIEMLASDLQKYREATKKVPQMEQLRHSSGLTLQILDARKEEIETILSSII